MAVPMLTGLERALAATGLPVRTVPGWRTRSGFAAGYREIVGTVLHTTESDDEEFASRAGRPTELSSLAALDGGEDAPTLRHAADADGTRGAHTYAVLIGRREALYLIAAGPGWQAGHGAWPRRTLGRNPGVPDDMANLHTIGVALDANEHGHPPTQFQLDALVRVLVALDEEWGERLAVIMHGEWQPPGARHGKGRTDPTGIPGGWEALRAARDRGAWTPASPDGGPPAGAGQNPSSSRMRSKSSSMTWSRSLFSRRR